MGTDNSSADGDQSLLDKIEHAKTTDERDDLYLQLALLAISRDDVKARHYAGKIDDSESRKQAQT
jgi:hypothetical protein